MPGYFDKKELAIIAIISSLGQLLQICASWQQSQEEKALLSQVGRHSEVDYSVIFADIQRLQGLYKKMCKCRTILDTSLDIATSHESFWQGLGTASHLSPSNTGTSPIETYKALLRNHRRSIQAILKTSIGISKIVSFLNIELVSHSYYIYKTTTNILIAQ